MHTSQGSIPFQPRGESKYQGWGVCVLLIHSIAHYIISVRDRQPDRSSIRGTTLHGLPTIQHCQFLPHAADWSGGNAYWNRVYFFNSVACADSIDFLRVWFIDIVSRPYKSEGKPIDLYRYTLTSVDKPGYEHPIAVRLYMAHRHACMRLPARRLLDILDEKIVPSISTDSEMLILCDPKYHKGLYIKSNLPDTIHWVFLIPNTKRHFIE